MSKIVLLLLAALTYYLAGMYLSLPLMILGTAELLLLIFLVILPRYLKRGLSVSFLKKSETAELGGEMRCQLVIHNTGKLPVSRARLRLKLKYAGEKKEVTRRLYFGAAKGDSETEFSFRTEYCGLIQIKADKLRVYDYMSLYSSSKPLDAYMEAAVFPVSSPLDIDLPAEAFDNTGVSELTADKTGENNDEIRQIREYRTGDSKRHIHWNLSAKTDKLWIKEYQKDADLTAGILLSCGGEIKTQQQSAFYSLFFSLALGLLQSAALVKVCWYDGGKGGYIIDEAANAEQLRELLVRLYRSNLSKADNAPAFEYLFRLTTDLELYGKEKLIRPFTAEDMTVENQYPDLLRRITITL